MSQLRPNIVAFGDSITQHGFSDGGWVAKLAEAYSRRVDVLNRGYSGYNSRWALALLPHIFPEGAPPPLAVTVFFGANDAVLPDRPSRRQYVPLAEYRSNLQKIVQQLRGRGVRHIVIITPPPIAENRRISKEYNPKANAEGILERSLQNTGSYATAAKETAAELGLPCVDAFEGFRREEDWEDMLYDGLHLAPSGNKKLFDLLMEQLSSIDALRPDILPWDLPVHDVLEGDAYGDEVNRYMDAKHAATDKQCQAA